MKSNNYIKIRKKNRRNKKYVIPVIQQLNDIIYWSILNKQALRIKTDIK